MAGGSLILWVICSVGVVYGVLSIIYIASASMLVFFGASLAWNGLAAGTERDAGQAHPVTGTILVVAGVLVFIFFPHLYKRLTGIEPFL